MKKIIMFVGVLLALSACQTVHPRHPHSNGDFCPPGQAKKGNC